MYIQRNIYVKILANILQVCNVILYAEHGHILMHVPVHNHVQNTAHRPLEFCHLHVVRALQNTRSCTQHTGLKNLHTHSTFITKHTQLYTAHRPIEFAHSQYVHYKTHAAVHCTQAYRIFTLTVRALQNTRRQLYTAQRPIEFAHSHYVHYKTLHSHTGTPENKGLIKTQ